MYSGLCIADLFGVFASGAFRPRIGVFLWTEKMTRLCTFSHKQQTVRQTEKQTLLPKINFQTLSYPKKPKRPLSYLKDRFAILYWTLSNCPGAPPGSTFLL